MGYINVTSKKRMRKISLTFAGLFCAAMMMFFMSAEALAESQGKVTASSANVRSSAGTEGAVVASVVNGDTVTITEETTGSDGKVWYKIVLADGSTGYIRSDLVAKSEDGGSTDVPASTGSSVNTDGVQAVQPISASVVKDQVRVRADSSTNSSIVTMVQKDVVLTVQGTKAGVGDEIWYLVSCVVEGQEVTGYVRSDYANLSGDLVPVVENTTEPTDTPEEPVQEEPVVETKDFETKQVDGVWYLLDYTQNSQYRISDLITAAEQNADELAKSEKQVSKQNNIILFLVVLVVVMVLGITLLIFKIRDMKDEEGFAEELALSRRNAANAQRTSRQDDTKAANGQSTGKPVAGTRPTGTRPAGTGTGTKTGTVKPASATGTKPGATKPASATGVKTTGNRPATAGTGAKPGTNKPAATATKPATGGVTGDTIVIKKEVAKPAAEEKSAKTHVKNFVSDDDEFEFEFLNWDDEK